ncbi:MAG: outer membrane protein assembly factor BamD [Bacteroidales bacterium]
MDKKYQIISALVFSAFMLMFSGCSQYQKLLKSADNELKYNKAIEYFNKGKYYKSLELFTQIQPFFRGTEKAEDVAYYISQNYYKQKDYIMAGYYFKMFSNSYIDSPRAEEAAFLSCYCSYLDSPKSTLDQKLTLDAISSLEYFKVRYPESEYTDQCNKLLYELRSKLEKKELDIANFYYKIYDYRAAIISYNNILKDYPETRYKEEILYYILSSQVAYAKNSVDDKKYERFTDAANTYENLKEGFPSGKYTQKAEAFREIIYSNLK